MLEPVWKSESYFQACSDITIEKEGYIMGKMYGIGVGPGDPELLTLKAHRLLNEADVIFCPEKAKGAGSFAFDIIKEHLKHSKA